MSVPRSPRIQRLPTAAVVFAIFGAANIAGPVPQALGAPTRHLVLILMENKEYTDVVGSTAAPYINGTLIPASKVFTQYYATDLPQPPQLPDAHLRDSGRMRGRCLSGGGRHGSEPLPPARQRRHLVEGVPRGYAVELLPRELRDLSRRHNPPAYYTDLLGGSCATNDVPFPQFAADLSARDATVLQLDHAEHLRRHALDQKWAPCNVGTVVMHEVCQGDQWLSQTLPALLALNTMRSDNNVTVVLTFDEGSSSDGGGGRVLTLVTGPTVTPGQDAKGVRPPGLAECDRGLVRSAEAAPGRPPL